MNYYEDDYISKESHDGAVEYACGRVADQLEREIDKYQKQVRELRAENARLREQVKALTRALRITRRCYGKLLTGRAPTAEMRIERDEALTAVDALAETEETHESH